ncbi:phage terminase small subunit [Vibrio cholerae]|uniref:phage terminase small subunit n=1 Tax=Vibrio cholerae TaxID=666 RepID=UPI001581891C|nr:phage terminase small subunit [Vibrio cholerae]QKU57319.1 hypothetical protein HPY04_14645 [Vibrio cholerae]
MSSPLRKQRDQILAKTTTPAAAAHAAAAESLDSLHLRLVEFEQDKQVLKGFVQISEKVNHKRDVLIPKYKPLAEKYLAAGESYQNPIFTDLIVWLFDIGDLERLQKAKALLITAHEKHDKIGVKTKINQIDMRINAINEGKNL